MSGIFDQLSDRIGQVSQLFKKAGKINETHLADAVKELRKALLEADVHYKVAKDFSNTIKEKLLGAEILKSVQPQELFLKKTYETLVEFLGQKSKDLTLGTPPNIFLMVGTQGVGKTTHTAKLGYFFEQKNKKVLLIAADIYRPAAIEQLKVLGAKYQIEVFSKENAKPLEIAQEGIEYGKKIGAQVIIIDTAGRTTLDAQMMQEIKELKEKLKPTKSFFVLDAVMGQEAVNIAKEFNENVSFDAVILTKMDDESGARGGSALSIQHLLQKPIQFIGTGEKIEALELFHPERIAGRILGQGDILSLVEEINKKIDFEETSKIHKKVMKQGFDCNTFLEQIQQIKKMGDMQKWMKMIPGASKMLKDMPLDQDMFKEAESIIYSMTPAERTDVSLIQKSNSRKERIAKGSGTTVQAVQQFLMQLEQLSKMMKLMGGQRGGLSQLMGQMDPSLLMRLKK